MSASLEVAKGAFRFTTGVFGNPRAERDVNVKFGTITAGVRGTDLWGRSVNSDDLVCLLEGGITVRHDKQEFVMNESLQFSSRRAMKNPSPWERCRKSKSTNGHWRPKSPKAMAPRAQTVSCVLS